MLASAHTFMQPVSVTWHRLCVWLLLLACLLEHVQLSSCSASSLQQEHLVARPDAGSTAATAAASSRHRHNGRTLLRGHVDDAQGLRPAAASAVASPAVQQEEHNDPTQRDVWDTEPTYSSHYASDAERPNLCKVAHQIPAAWDKGVYNFTGDRSYVPFLGTSIVKDSQLMLMRLYYSIDYPVKWFVVVVGEQALAGRNAIAYQVKHLVEYPKDKVGVVVISCQHQPAVSESWNAIFQTFKEEPWGVYMARDTFWEPGALANLSRHGWEAAQTGNVEVGYVKWSNMGEREAIHNIFMMTSRAIKRFGLWDENIYPAFCEDIDMMRRVKVMDPPLKEQQFMDVLAVHGKRTQHKYLSGTTLPDDPSIKEEKELTRVTLNVRSSANCNYFMRKWGCPSDEKPGWMSRTDDCRFKTPFNKSVPHWYWHTNKQLREYDRWVTLRPGPDGKPALADSRTNEVIFEVPPHYGEWGGYFEKSSVCRLSGYLGRLNQMDQWGRTMCL